MPFATNANLDVCFDSILVRLKGYAEAHTPDRRIRFDSILVRLKEITVELLFQFINCFDSILVRLKVQYP